MGTKIWKGWFYTCWIVLWLAHGYLWADAYSNQLEEDLAAHISQVRGAPYDASTFRAQTNELLNGSNEAETLTHFVAQGLKNVSYAQSMSETMRWVNHPQVTQAVELQANVTRSWWTRTMFAPLNRTVTQGKGAVAVMWVKLLENPNKYKHGLCRFEVRVNGTSVKSPQYPITHEWKRLVYPFTMPKGGSDGILKLIVGEQTQNVLAAGARLYYFPDHPSLLNQLPKTKLSIAELGDYEGRTSSYNDNKTWLNEAKTSIHNHRMAKLNIEVRDRLGKLIPNAKVKVNMKQHAFNFGMTIKEWFLRHSGDPYQLGDAPSTHHGDQLADTYMHKLMNMGGEGKGPSMVTFAGRFRWRHWDLGKQPEGYNEWNKFNWISMEGDNDSTLWSMDWFNQQGINVRGHYLTWGKGTYMPDSVWALRGNETAYWQAFKDRSAETAASAGGITVWDVINEPFYNKAVEGMSHGIDGYAELIKIAKQNDPQARSIINDNQLLTGGGLQQYKLEYSQNLMDRMLSLGAPLDGYGFQAHVDGEVPLTSPRRVQEVIDEFKAVADARGLPSMFEVTEFDMKLDALPEGGPDHYSPEIKALERDYMRDFMTACFAHPSIDTFIIWGMWDKDHWLGNAPIYDDEWNLKPSGEEYIDLVYNKWWTNLDGQANATGVYEDRVFKGKHQIVVEFNGVEEVFEMNITNNQHISVSLNVELENSALPARPVYEATFDEPMDLPSGVSQSSHVPSAIGSGKSLYFNGSAKPIKFPVQDFGRNNYSISVWANFSSFGNRAILGYDSIKHHYFGMNNRTYKRYMYRTWNGNNLLTENYSAKINTWQHFVIVKYGGGASLYIDDRWVSHVDVNKDAIWDTLGKCGNGWNMHGYIDNLRFYDRALNATERRSLHENDRLFQIPQDTVYEQSFDDVNSWPSGISQSNDLAGSKMVGSSAYFGTAHHGFPIPSVHFDRGDYSFSVWAKFESFGDRAILGFTPAKYHHLCLDNPTYQRLRYRNWNGNQIVGPNFGVDLNRWYHFTVIHQNGIASLYVDNELLGSMESNKNSEWDVIGSANGGRHMHGWIDNLRMYNRAISESERNALFAEGQ